jgi:nucleotide-binding universal stress UspA family protein
VERNESSHVGSYPCTPGRIASGRVRPAHAVALAQAFGSQLTLLSAIARAEDETGGLTVDPLNWQIRKAESVAYLDEVLARLREDGVEAERLVVEGGAAEQIVEFARTRAVDLIVLSSHGRSGLSEWNISSVVQKVILRAFVPVLIVRAYKGGSEDLTHLRYRRLLMPLDGSRRAEYALPLAAALSTSHASALILAHVVHRPEVPRAIPLSQEEMSLVEELTALNRDRGAAYLRDLEPRVGIRAETRLLVSHNPAVALHQLVDEEEIDLVILTAHGYSGGTKWPYGSVALNFVVYGSTPLLIVQDISEEESEPTEAQLAARETRGH